MNQFEFLPLVTIGQYYPTGSILHRLDARAKLVVFSGLVLAVTFTPSMIGLLIALAAVLIGIFVAKVTFKSALKGLLAPLPFLIFIALLQLFFFSSQVNTVVYFSWWIFHITLAGIFSAVVLLLRFVVLILTISLSSFCLSTSEMITGLDHLLSPLKHLGIQTMDLVMVIQVALRFLPLLAISAERIAKAQASRGAEWGTRRGGLIAQVRRVIPLIVPLFLTSLRRSEALALAMDARAYGLKNQRTSIYELNYQRKDTIFLLIGLLVTFSSLLF
jgi:energy-coupling factor transport system permease protein